MAMYAPESPTTQELHEQYPLEQDTAIEIGLARERIGGILSGRQEGLVAIIGPCAMNGQEDIIAVEGQQLKRLTTQTEGLYVAHRTPVWKPRTNPDDWHGRETTEPREAYATLTRQAANGTGMSIELASQQHMERYSHALTIGWIGGRNIGATAMMEAVALYDSGLPLAIKNGLDGDITPALQAVEKLNDLRGEDAAPVVLLYRGGENAQTAKDWETRYREALDRTDGHMIVDVAHGSEMAHDPAGKFRKSVQGQADALEHVIRVARDHGTAPAGIMMEASEADSPTDPHLPLDIALEGLRRLHGLAHQPRRSDTINASDPWQRAIDGMLRAGHL